ncbi:ankyrin repeat domain-containing protein [Pyxidicoccus xibeiensis]|uniref:ankyrin repeat domain-containing protein n=1 Tax=Pyxidicoccus xibeiensis TaxID=2906759 RepID=UPI0020A770E6|nr:ankyrin repeat domain-containing protein [Pyxidicoccus xibeiensis]MCP3138635.1 ankyrin repeat domain-containing protein [Pyxidicoccus xibeiensis]
MPRTQAPKKVNVAALMKKVDRLLDESSLDFDEAIPLLRQVLAAEPDHLRALHALNWSLDPSRRVDPLRWERELKAEHWRIRDRILELTRGTKPGGKLSDAQRARSLALSQWAEEVVKGRPAPASLDAVESALEEAHGLRELVDHARALRGLEAWRLLARGKQGYQELLARVEAAPELRAFDAEGDDDPLNFQGLEGAFSDEGFVAWLRRKKPAVRPKGQKGKALDEGLLLAAGLDARTGDYGPGFRDAGRVGRVLALRALGANLEARDSGKQGALHLATMVDDAALVKELLRLGLSPGVTAEGKATALHAAAEYGAVSCVPVLARGGVPVDAFDNNGRTALFLARQPEVARALLDAGADPNAGKGWTPLHVHARFHERGPVIEVLLQAGADANRKDANRRTPVQEALDHNNPHLAELMGAKAPSGGAGGLDVQSVLDELARRKKALLKAWYYEDEDVEDVERVLKSLALGGATSWDQAATALQGVPAWTAMAVVELARAVLPPEQKTPSFSKAPRFVRGDLTVKKDVNLSGPLLVTGNLTVEGVLRNAGPEGLLVVGGSLRATGLDTSGEVVVGEDLVAQVVWGHYNDHSLLVGGTLKADVVIEDDHNVVARVKARHHFEREEFDESDAALKKVFARAAFSSEGLDRYKLFNLLRKGRSVLA